MALRRRAPARRRPVDWINTGAVGDVNTVVIEPATTPGLTSSIITVDLLDVQNEIFPTGGVDTGKALVRAMTNPTLVRCRGNLSLKLESVANNSAGSPVVQAYALAAAIMVAPEQAVAAAALPNPAFENGDFLWFSKSFHSNAVTASTVLVGPQTNDPQFVEVDSKAMRKLRENEKTICYVFGCIIAWSAQIDQGSQTDYDWEFESGLRMLMKDG